MSSGVEFEEDKLKYARSASSTAYGSGFPAGGDNQPKMVRWLMTKGIVKSPNGAQVILIAVVIINIIITYVVITRFF